QHVKILDPQDKKQNNIKNSFEMLFPAQEDNEDHQKEEVKDEDIKTKRDQVARQLALGELEEHIVTVEIEEVPPSMFDMLQGSGMEQMCMHLQDALGLCMTNYNK